MTEVRCPDCERIIASADESGIVIPIVTPLSNFFCKAAGHKIGLSGDCPRRRSVTTASDQSFRPTPPSTPFESPPSGLRPEGWGPEAAAVRPYLGASSLLSAGPWTPPPSPARSP